MINDTSIGSSFIQDQFSRFQQVGRSAGRSPFAAWLRHVYAHRRVQHTHMNMHTHASTRALSSGDKTRAGGRAGGRRVAESVPRVGDGHYAKRACRNKGVKEAKLP